jgi:hypothetical protein
MVLGDMVQNKIAAQTDASFSQRLGELQQVILGAQGWRNFFKVCHCKAAVVRAFCCLEEG